MAMIQHPVVVGVFAEPRQAQHAIDELRRAGFGNDEIGYLTRATTTEPGNEAAGKVATDAVDGGVIGGVLGAAAAFLIPGFGPAIAGGILVAIFGGAAIGALTGGLIGSLTSMGVQEQDARFYQTQLEEGRTIVTVKTPSGYDEAMAILTRNGAYNATTESALINPPPPLRPEVQPPYGPGTPSEPSNPDAHPRINDERLPRTDTWDDRST